MNLTKLLRPKSLAVVGGYWADIVLEQNRKLGFKGPIWHIHPSRKSKKGHEYFQNSSQLPESPDCAFLGVSRDLTVETIADLASVGLGGAVCFASRFSETNTEVGLEYTNRLIKSAEDVPFLGPNCYGFINYLDRVAGWPDQIGSEPVERGVALICQSGTIGNTLNYNLRSLPIGYIVSVGNQTCISIEDVAEYVLEDHRVTAIGIYVEGFKNLESLINVLKKARQKKIPVAIVKTGRSESAVKTIKSHTGVLSGSDELYDTLFDRLGAARCNSLAELCETLKIFHTIGPLNGNKVTVMGPSGGDMAMTADLSNDLGLTFPPFPKIIAKQLGEILDENVTISNPFDFQVFSWTNLELMRKTFDLVLKAEFNLTCLMLDCPNTDLCEISSFESVIEQFLISSQSTKAPTAIIASLPETLPKHIRKKCLSLGVIPLQGLQEALSAINNAILIKEAWEHPQDVKIIKSSKSVSSSKTYTEYEAKKILKLAGIHIPRSILTTVPDVIETSEKIGYPVVLKVSSDNILHKSDVHGVALNLNNQEEISKALEKISKISSEVLVEEMITDSVVEMIVGVKVDEQFGPVIVVGAGGNLTELLEDSISLLLPLSKADILKAIKKLKVDKLLDGYRGGTEGDKDALVKAIINLVNFSEKNADNLLELDINPLAVRPKGKGVIALDALIHYVGDKEIINV